MQFKTFFKVTRLAVFAMIMGFISCSSNDSESPAPKEDLKISVETLEFTDAASKLSFTVESANNWTVNVKSSTEFATVSPAGGKATTEPEKVTVTVTANNETTARTATITITSGDKKKTVTVTQAGSTLTNSSSHDVTFSSSKLAYLNKGVFEGQMVTSEDEEYVQDCNVYGTSVYQLVYNVTIQEEGDLTITTIDEHCSIYITANVANAKECIWVAKENAVADKSTTLTTHLRPQKGDNKPYLVVLTCSKDIDPAEYNYSVRMDFQPRVVDVPVPENGIKVAGAIWSKSNSIYKDGKVAFADSPDANCDLWQYNQAKPASAGNWYDPTWDDYTDDARKAGSLKDPRYIPCPKGWTYPTNAQVTALIASGYTIVAKGTKGATNNGGIFFGDNSSSATISDPKDCLFLPFVGYIDGNGAAGYPEMPERQGTGTDGEPLQSHYTLKDIQQNDGTYFLVIASEEVDIKGKLKEVGITEGWSRPWRAQAVRCVYIEE